MMANMTEEDLIHAVNKIHADAGLKSKVMTGKSSPHTHRTVWQPLLKSAACLAAVAIVVFTVLAVPRVLKPVTSVTQSGNTAVSNSFSQPGIVNGLYHDDAVQNILLLYSQKYADSDAVYTNQMLLVSIDSRHNKLKITSIDGGIYADVPGYQKNSLRSVYSLGKAPLVVQTIEKNFGIDIDQYVLFDQDHFGKILDCFGSAPAKISSWQAEQINRYSGEEKSKYLNAGTVNLTGKQLLYYWQLLQLEDRIQPEPDVITSLVENKLKSSNAGEISEIISQTLPMVTTDMKKTGIAALSDSLAGIHYSQNDLKVPADSYQEKEIPIINSKEKQSIKIIDFQINQQLMFKYIYEDSADSSH